MKHESYFKHKKELKFNPDNFYCNNVYLDKDTCLAYVMGKCYGCNSVEMGIRK